MNRTPTRRRAITRQASCAAALAVAALAVSPSPAAAKPVCAFYGVSSLAFGAYDPLSAAPLDSTAVLRYECPPGQPVRVTLDTGQSGTFTWRELRGGGEVLRYNLYLDAARTIVWGDGTAGTAVGPLVKDVARGVTSAWVFGRVPPAQDVTVGAYADTITVTVDL
jgi:spore coat protein U-like protein